MARVFELGKRGMPGWTYVYGIKSVHKLIAISDCEVMDIYAHLSTDT